MKTYMYLLIGVAVLAVILVIVLAVIAQKKKKQEKKPKLDQTVLKRIFIALGDKNIVSIKKEQDRIKVILIDVKPVDTKVFTELSIPVFLKGKELTLLYRNFSEDLYLYIEEKLKED